MGADGESMPSSCQSVNEDIDKQLRDRLKRRYNEREVMVNRFVLLLTFTENGDVMLAARSRRGRSDCRSPLVQKKSGKSVMSVS